MNWISARLSERSSQAALAQLLTIWTGAGAGALSGASTAPMNMLLAGALTATVPCLVAIFLPEAAPHVPAPSQPAPAAPAASQPAPEGQ